MSQADELERYLNNPRALAHLLELLLEYDLVSDVPDESPDELIEFFRTIATSEPSEGFAYASQRPEAERLEQIARFCNNEASVLARMEWLLNQVPEVPAPGADENTLDWALKHAPDKVLMLPWRRTSG